jgi:hypothetical protein
VAPKFPSAVCSFICCGTKISFGCLFLHLLWHQILS